ncbi:MAG: glycosyltransferase family 39 protein [Mycobacteriaceae bacterium]|nr:glycosyltransferase family 39 protein [Mycobacteriaceae bacterium]MBV9638199.1 glycosyltransferase family 39 protein [Mycobacteriaceae bacterium]
MSAPALSVADAAHRDRPATGPTVPPDPRWARPALAALLAVTALFWVTGLSRTGWANPFYSAAVQAGTKSWTAFLFGSSDAGNSITVDKPPASLWPMELSGRVFGVNTWSVLLPEVLLGLASVALVYVIVKRHFGPTAGLIAGGVLALTPVATLMFRYNNPDALLVFVMIAAAWALMRGVGDGRTRWLVLCGALIGFGFLTKQLQVMLVVPGLALTYLVAGPVRLRVRVLQLGAGLLAMVAAAGWWVLVVSLIPAADRPYIGGSTDDSFLNLTFGYNGVSRLLGGHLGEFRGGPRQPPGGPGGAGPGFSFGSHAGLTRLFSGEAGGQISWLLPAALIFLAGGIVLCGRVSRTDERRAQYLVWGGWLIGTGAVLSFMSGMFHDYYTVALSPAIAALVGIGVTQLWARRGSRWVGVTLAVTVALTAAWSWVLLGRSPGFVPPLRWVVLAAALGWVLAYVLRVHRFGGHVAWWAAALAAAAALAGPLAYSVETVGSPHNGGIVTAGPSVRGSRFPGMPPGMGQPPSDRIVRMLSQDAAAYTWVAATTGANEAAAYQLATGDAVMPIGGFIGSDPSPTLAQFQRDVADGRVHYYLEGHRPGTPRAGDARGASPGGRPDTEGDKIAAWVRQTFTPTTVDGVTYYDLTAPVT